MQLNYRLWNQVGNQTTNKIILLHGMGGTGALWRPVAIGLENQMMVLSPDQRGHGGSCIQTKEPVGYSPLDYGKDVIDTIQALDFHPTWLLGHSMGVRTAVAAAQLRPEWIEGLILVDLGFSGEAGGGLGDQLGHFLKILPRKFISREAARKFMDLNCPDPSIGQYLMAVAVKESDGGVAFPFDHEALIRTIDSARDSSVREWIKELAGKHQMKILVLRGAQSKVWSREEYAQEVLEFAPYRSVVFKEISGAGHGLPFEQRATFVKEIQDFITMN